MATRKSVRTVLAAIADPEASGQVAARKAVEIAWLFGADVVLYHACYESSLSGGVLFDSAHLAAARRDHVARAAVRLGEMASSLGASELRIQVRTEWARSIPEAVARAATREGADIVVAEPRYSSTRRSADCRGSTGRLPGCARCPCCWLVARPRTRNPGCSPRSTPAHTACASRRSISASPAWLQRSLPLPMARCGSSTACAIPVWHSRSGPQPCGVSGCASRR